MEDDEDIASRQNMSRYGQPRVLKKVGDNEYTISGKSSYMRWGSGKEGIEYADFDGGPFIAIGADIAFFGAKDDSRRITKIVNGGSPEDGVGLATLRLFVA